MASSNTNFKKSAKEKSVTTTKANIKNDVTSLKDSNNKNRNKLAKAAEIRAAKAVAARPVVIGTSDGVSNDPTAEPGTRIRRHLARYRPFNKDAAQTQSTFKVPPVWHITRLAITTLKQNWKLFAGIIAVYAVLTLLFARGLSGAENINTLRDLFEGELGRLAESFVIFISLVSASSNNPNPVSGLYQSIFAIVTSLAIVWALRQVFSGTTKVRVRDTFYKGMYPLVPVLIILLVISLQIIPFLLGATIYATVENAGLAVSIFEQIMWIILFFIFTLVSLYFVTSSIIALYIAALPDMTPLQALRSARDLVRYRRWTIMRKMLFLPLMIFVLAAVVMIPVILVATPAAPVVYFVLTMLVLPIAHAYLYALYRELLR